MDEQLRMGSLFVGMMGCVATTMAAIWAWKVKEDLAWAVVVVLGVGASWLITLGT